ncbi:Bug family tripartite tricarboxylate transporter substrate binding protein [Comamonas thiooxydans]|uniref:Bug family tripartite tricarboxylate transporter substrate binding protein n=1 Tax=Comamonas thiooxydans TaxID=363952 RepID=UPI0022B245AE|nr:tripartite tricarboxylate transporter substrate-binding protein [Comamonas thiooxydans]
MAGYSLVQGYVEQGSMRPIAVMGDKRLPFQPEVPTFAEQGVPLKATLWYGLFAPGATSAQHVQAMNAAVNRAVEKVVAEKRVEPKWFAPRALSQSQFALLVKQETAIWGDVAQRSGIKLD